MDLYTFSLKKGGGKEMEEGGMEGRHVLYRSRVPKTLNLLIFGFNIKLIFSPYKVLTLLSALSFLNNYTTGTRGNAGFKAIC